MLFMIVEHFKEGAPPIYDRFHKKGRMMPEGLTYLDSWVYDNALKDMMNRLFGSGIIAFVCAERLHNE